MPDKKQDAKMLALFKKGHSIRSIARDTYRSRSDAHGHASRNLDSNPKVKELSVFADLKPCIFNNRKFGSPVWIRTYNPSVTEGYPCVCQLGGGLL